MMSSSRFSTETSVSRRPHVLRDKDPDHQPSNRAKIATASPESFTRCTRSPTAAGTAGPQPCARIRDVRARTTALGRASGMTTGRTTGSWKTGILAHPHSTGASLPGHAAPPFLPTRPPAETLDGQATKRRRQEANPRWVRVRGACITHIRLVSKCTPTWYRRHFRPIRHVRNSGYTTSRCNEGKDVSS